MKLHSLFNIGAAFILLSVLIPPLQAFAINEPVSGDLVKASGPAVYYYGSDNKRYVFPNSGIYFSWYKDFSTVKTISPEQLASMQIGGNVTFKPGNLIKLASVPNVYAISKDGTLRWVTSESVANTIFGKTWNKKVYDLAEAFFVNYKMGEPINSPSDYDLTKEQSEAKDIAADKNLDLVESQNSAISFPQIPPINQPQIQDLPKTPLPVNNQQPAKESFTQLIITNVKVSASTSGASIEWETNSPSNGKIFVVVGSTTQVFLSGSGLSTKHVASASGLQPGNKYSFSVESISGAQVVAKYSADFTTTLYPTLEQWQIPSTKQLVVRPAYKSVEFAGNQNITVSFQGKDILFEQSKSNLAQVLNLEANKEYSYTWTYKEEGRQDSIFSNTFKTLDVLQTVNCAITNGGVPIILKFDCSFSSDVEAQTIDLRIMNGKDTAIKMFWIKYFDSKNVLKENLEQVIIEANSNKIIHLKIEGVGTTKGKVEILPYIAEDNAQLFHLGNLKLLEPSSGEQLTALPLN